MKRMIRIGIIGSENSHAMAFARIFNLSGKYPDIRVVGVYGEDAAESQKIHEECGTEFIADRPEDMLGRVDAVMFTSRNGMLHPKYALPYVEAGLPMFIDKPIANTGEEAYALLKSIDDRGVHVMGGSSIKFAEGLSALRFAAWESAKSKTLLGGHFWAPVSMENPYGDFSFYASHLIEAVTFVYGFEPRFTWAERVSGGVAAVITYDEFSVHLSFTDGVYHYGGTVLTKGGAVTREIDISRSMDKMAGDFALMLYVDASYHKIENLAIPIYVMNAIERAYLSGEKQRIDTPLY